MLILILFTAYLVIGNLLHRYVFPDKLPHVSTWFKPGQVLYSKTEGIHQTVIKHEKDHVHCATIVEPFADGPPKHIHTGFDEIFEVQNGELSVWVDGTIKKVKPGEVLHISKGTPHKPFNTTADTIYIKGAIAFPEKFAFYLKQVYAIMDKNPGYLQSPKAMFQMSIFQSKGFDSYAVEGPPVFIQKAFGIIMPPMLRLFGYKSYYKQYDPFVVGNSK